MQTPSTYAPTPTPSCQIAVAGAQAVESAGGPAIAVRLGRRDALDPPRPTPRDLSRTYGPPTSALSRATVSRALPEAGLDADGLTNFYARVGLGAPEDIVALSGAHTLGRHVSLLGLEKEQSEVRKSEPVRTTTATTWPTAGPPPPPPRRQPPPPAHHFDALPPLRCPLTTRHH